MKAIVYTHYGPPDVLQLQEVAKPTPRDDEVLVKVHAAAVNSWDWDLVTGRPLLYRLLFGLRNPTYPIIGSDIAGQVAAVGSNVTQFQPGDAVFGDISGCGFGAFAEYVCARAAVLALKPAGMTFEAAAAVPQAGVLALQGLRQGQIQPGHEVLINGAGGGVGTFAIQIARAFGAEVTGVDHTRKLDLMRSLGADQVIDYTHADFTRTGQQYDLILDVVAKRSPFDYMRALRHRGSLVVVGGTIAAILQTVILGTWLSMTGRRKMGMLAHKPDPRDVERITELVEAGKVVPVIDRRYPLSEVAAALRYLGAGHARGKVVITM